HRARGGAKPRRGCQPAGLPGGGSRLVSRRPVCEAGVRRSRLARPSPAPGRGRKMKKAVIERWTPESRVAMVAAVLILAVLVAAPALFSANAVDKLTTLFIYVILAVMWNALVGFCGLVSIGQQAFFGLGAYAAVRLADLGVSVYPSLFAAALIVGLLSLPLSVVMLRLKGGEFAIGMWVVSELAHLLVNLDTLVRGETGTSLIELNAYSIETRRAATYFCALAGMAGLLAVVFWLLRSPLGAAIRAIRDNGEATGFRFGRVRRRARGRALGDDRPHVSAQGLFQPAVDGVHDLHGAGRRARNIRGRDPRRDRLFRHRSLVRAGGRLVSRRARSDRARLRARLSARRLGLGRRQYGAEDPADRLPAAPRAGTREDTKSSLREVGGRSLNGERHAARKDDCRDRDLLRDWIAHRRTRDGFRSRRDRGRRQRFREAARSLRPGRYRLASGCSGNR